MLNLKVFAAVFVFAGLVSASLIDVPMANSKPVNQVVDYRVLVTALREDIRDTKIIDKLGINTKNKFRLVIPNKCEKEGESDLHQLASSARVEESYILIPTLCLWIELGYEEKRNGVRLDSKFISAIVEQYSSLIFYHIHPGDLPDVESHFPAYKDLITLVLINANSVWKPNIQIKHRLITKLGTMEYSFSNKQKVEYFMNKFREIGLRGYEAQNLAYEYVRPKYRNDYYTKVQNCRLYSGTVQQKIIDCCPIITEAFTLNFRPTTAAMKYRITVD